MGKKGKQVAMLDDPQQLSDFTFIANKTEHFVCLMLKATRLQVLTEWHNSFHMF